MSFKVFIGIVIIFVLAVAAIFGYFYFIPHMNSNFGNETKYFTVKKGDSVKLIGENLENIGAVKSGADFVFFAKLLRKSNYLKVGRYAIKPHSSLSHLIGTISRGESIPLNVTIPEGFTIWQIGNLLQTSLDLDIERFRDNAVDRQFLDSLKIPGKDLEGYLAPSTYNLYYDENPRRVIQKMVAHFFQSLPDSFEAKASRLGFTIHQAVILASLVEKEAKLDNERPIIAAVYLNRLRIGMKLDCDPTVIYALGGINRPLAKDDLNFSSPYNTYQNPGLPPGPISNPGVKSLEAAVNPAKTGFLYFVARGDGSHQFSLTLDDHNTAVGRVRRHNGKK